MFFSKKIISIWPTVLGLSREARLQINHHHKQLWHKKLQPITMFGNMIYRAKEQRFLLCRTPLTDIPHPRIFWMSNDAPMFGVSGDVVIFSLKVLGPVFLSIDQRRPNMGQNSWYQPLHNSSVNREWSHQIFANVLRHVRKPRARSVTRLLLCLRMRAFSCCLIIWSLVSIFSGCW